MMLKVLIVLTASLKYKRLKQVIQKSYGSAHFTETCAAESLRLFLVSIVSGKLGVIPLESKNESLTYYLDSSLSAAQQPQLGIFSYLLFISWLYSSLNALL
ncbi:hypothetical protein ILYODFUR_011045 [Ilyodon furcidens]|uniref:Uncharacterized protein n=1 Tax=Ilyodon furcidens TaxID=33524 RepID=A0ABV0VFE8_9TELE